MERILILSRRLANIGSTIFLDKQLCLYCHYFRCQREQNNKKNCFFYF